MVSKALPFSTTQTRYSFYYPEPICTWLCVRGRCSKKVDCYLEKRPRNHRESRSWIVHLRDIPLTVLVVVFIKKKTFPRKTEKTRHCLFISYTNDCSKGHFHDGNTFLSAAYFRASTNYTYWCTRRNLPNEKRVRNCIDFAYIDLDFARLSDINVSVPESDFLTEMNDSLCFYLKSIIIRFSVFFF